MKNNVILNLNNNWEDKWAGIIFDTWKLTIPKVQISIDKIKTISVFGKKIMLEDIEEFGEYIVLEPEKTEWESIHSIEYLKEVINEYYSEIENSMTKAGITQFEFSVDFCISNNGYYIYRDNPGSGWAREEEICDAIDGGIGLIASIDITNQINISSAVIDSTYINIEVTSENGISKKFFNEIESEIGIIKNFEFYGGIVNIVVEIKKFINASSIKQLIEENLEAKSKLDAILKANNIREYRAIFN